MPQSNPEIVIVGSGMGGATLAAALAPSGRSIVILERGNHLEDTPECRDDRAIFTQGFFRPQENWLNGEGESFNPGNYYHVGGNTKFYGAVLLRYRAEDFKKMNHLGGISPAWPVSYTEFEPWYQMAEEMYHVHGDASQDSSEPDHSGDYPYPPVKDEEPIAQMRQRLVKAGMRPSALPLAMDIDQWLSKAKTPWDGFPGTNDGKYDAETIGISQALKHENVKLLTGAKVTRFIAGKDGCITGVEYETEGEIRQLNPKIVILSAGAVNSAALLLSSANDKYPNGLANSSDMVGRNFMNHNCSALLAIHPFRKNRAIYQKTLQINDFYLRGGPNDMPLGNIQLLGKISGTILAGQTSLSKWVADWVANHSVDWYAMSEDLPNPDSRVMIKNNQIMLDWKRSNWEAHEALVKKATKSLRRAGYPIILSRAFDRRTPSHQCGTLKFGTNPKTSVLDVYCRTHDHKNLFVVDASFLPTSAAVNPALTIAAQALRVANHILEKDLAT